MIRLRIIQCQDRASEWETILEMALRQQKLRSRILQHVVNTILREFRINRNISAARF
ncbi:hypothetical protein D3C74_507290 [compost metagenome]